MTDTVLDKPDLIDRAEIRGDKVLVAYSRTEAALADLRQRYTGAAFDLTTTAGDREARRARLELVTLRNDLEKKRKEFKAPALAFGKAIDSEAARITNEIEKLELPIDAQIKADEERRAAEKAAREAEAARVEAERRGKHLAELAKIRGYVGQAQGKPSDKLKAGHDYVLTRIDQFDAAAWEEFASEALCELGKAADAIEELLTKTLADEKRAAEAEAQRQENARQAAELEAQRKELAERAAKMKADAEELQRKLDMQAAREAEAARAQKAMYDELKKAQEVRQHADILASATTADMEVAAAGIRSMADKFHFGGDMAPPPEYVEDNIDRIVREQMNASAAAHAAKQPPDDGARITIGELCAEIGGECKAGFSMTSGFVDAVLGVKPAGMRATAKLYTLPQRAQILRALAARLESLA